MRLRHERRIRKWLRQSREFAFLRDELRKCEHQGFSFADALKRCAAEFQNYIAAGQAIRLLSGVGIDLLPQTLQHFFTQVDAQELYETALVLETLDDLRLVQPLIAALNGDPSPHRRKAAARALGWMRTPRRRMAARALARCLGDPAQPQPAREEAAESLAYVGTGETIPVLIDALRDPDVRIRFWSVFGLGGSRDEDPRAVAALESVLDDHAVPSGNWWSVGKEALANLASGEHPISAYARKLEEETTRILADPNASVEDRRWAECHARSERNTN